jgi:hypothetical protein
MAEALRQIAFPDEWAGTPIDQRMYNAKGRDDVIVFSVLLKSGANMHALVFPDGHRFARVAPETNWALEERYHGDPHPGDCSVVNKTWRVVITGMVAAGRKTRAELAANPDPFYCPACAAPPKFQFVTTPAAGVCPRCMGPMHRRTD